MRSRAASLAPNAGTSPLTCSRPSRIQRSTSRREPMPAADSSFCTRSRRGSLPASSPWARRPPCGAAPRRRGAAWPRGINPHRLRRRVRPGLAAAATRALRGSGPHLVRRRIGIRSPCVRGSASRGLRAPPPAAHLRLGARQRQLHAQILELLELRQRRQIVQLLQAEVVEKFAGGAEQLRLARHVAMTDDANPVALEQGLDDVRVHRHAANLLRFRRA